MKEKYGIDNIKIAILAAIRIAKIINDRKLGIWKLIFKHGKEIIKNFNTYKKFDYKVVLEEFKDLDSAELNHLYSFIQIEAQVKSTKVKEIISGAFEMANGIEKILKNVKRN